MKRKIITALRDFIFLFGYAMLIWFIVEAIWFVLEGF